MKEQQQQLNAASPVWLDNQTLGAVRPEVRNLLEASLGFQQLPDDEKRELAKTMVKVAAYMANPDGLVTSNGQTRNGPLARAADAVEDTKKRLSQKQAFAGKDFEAGAVKQGVEQFGALVQKVDFPKFVGGLIQNVFQAIVDASIQQMRAYGELMANVAKSVDQFAQDNISENNARDWLAEKFPDKLAIDETSMSSGFAEDGMTVPPAPKLTVTAEDPEQAMREVSALLNLEKPITDLSDENQELQLVIEARKAMARSRQQMLASMVMLGINRIVVTDGLIHAKVIFDMKASDVAKRAARASMHDQQKSATSANFGVGGWGLGGFFGGGVNTSSEHMATVQSSVDDTSESKAEVKAKLSGEVRVNFKSDYFPMEKLASPQMIAAIQGNAQPVERPVAGAG
jgi:hypothetical protein